MRNLSFYPLFFIFLFFYCFQANAQALKTYSGKFKGGQATYTYRDNPEGGRIYEGKFSYVSGAFQATGNYKNDMKDGLWTYKDSDNLLKIYYKNGVRDGIFSYSGSAGKANLTFKNNRIVGEVNVSGEISFGLGGSVIVASGTLIGQCDEEGYADGIWIADATSYNGQIYRVTYKNGYYMKSSIEDITTGDIKIENINIAYNVVEAAKKRFLEFLDRGTVPFDVNYEITKQGTPPAENETPESESDKILEVAEVMPQFPGGQSELMAYLAKNIKYPATAQENGTQGRVIVEFVVKSDGSISDVQVARSVDPALDQEAIRLIESMPKWIPGRQNGQNVNVKYTLPILFKL